VECDKNGKVYFISCHTGNVMQCDENGFARCDQQESARMGGMDHPSPPSNCHMMTSAQLRLYSFTASGAVLFPLIGLAAGAMMVPSAMATFGTVVAGVGNLSCVSHVRWVVLLCYKQRQQHSYLVGPLEPELLLGPPRPVLYRVMMEMRARSLLTDHP
jgi:hypothetical protein